MNNDSLSTSYAQAAPTVCLRRSCSFRRLWLGLIGFGGRTLVCTLALAIVVLYSGGCVRTAPKSVTPTAGVSATTAIEIPTISAPTKLPTSTLAPEGTIVGVIVTDRAYLYSSPNKDSGSFGSIARGTSVVLTGRTAKADWYRIRTMTSSGDIVVEGWVSADQIYAQTLLSDLQNVPVITEPIPTTTRPSPTATKTAAPTPTTTHPSPTVTKTTAPTATLLPAPPLLGPPDQATFDSFAKVILSWSGVKSSLAADEYYSITLRFNHGGRIWMDYAQTQQTSWAVNEHKYLLDLTDDGLFHWSVTLVRQTGINANVECIALSQNSEERTFAWKLPESTRIPPKPTPTPTYKPPYP